MAELGNSLSRARRARGITLEDAERDTHVSRRYLQALESDDFSIFPAPVYARGFLRTYSRYLGLNPEELVRVLPSGAMTVDITPLPTVTRPQTQMINMNWLVAGLVLIFLLGAGMLLLRGGDDGTTVQTTNGLTSGATLAPNSSNPLASPAATGQAQGRAIDAIRPGQIPDFVGADLASTLSVLTSNQMAYAIIEASNRNTPKGIVVSQTPSAGSKSDANTTVVLYVSSGQPAQ